MTAAFLLIVGLAALCYGIAKAPEHVTQMVLTLVWGLMIVTAIGTTIWELLR